MVNAPDMQQSTWMAQVPMDATNASRALVATILQGDASARPTSS